MRIPRCQPAWLPAHSALLLLYLALAHLAASVAAADPTNEAVDLDEQYLAISNSSLRWLQRPNLYCGIVARVQGNSPLFGLMWYGLQDYAGYQSERARRNARIYSQLTAVADGS